MKVRNNEILLKESVSKALLKLGIPTMISMMVSALYNLVDTFFVGTLGTSQQAAVSAVFPIGLIMLGVGLLFGCGAGSYIARLLGKGDKKQADECASTALGIATITAVILVIIMWLFLNPLLLLLGCTKTMLPYAKIYAIPFIGGLVINVFNATISNITTSEGASIYSMQAMLFGGITNIVLDPVLIIVFHMGVFGAALATLISRIVSLSYYLIYLYKGESSLHYSVKNIHITKEIVTEIAQIGIPTCIYQILSSIALSIMNNQAAPFGDSVIAVCGIVSRIMTLGFMIIMGFMKGYQVFVGYNYGAKKYERVQLATKKALIWSTTFTIICSILLIVFRISIISMFNANDAVVIEIGSRALLYNAITFLTIGIQMVYTTKFMGLGKGKEGGMISMGRQGFFFIPVIYFMTMFFGLNGLILAQPIADVMSTILVSTLIAKNMKEEKNLIKIEKLEAMV